jgi:SAM-dependent methyltransferase
MFNGNSTGMKTIFRLPYFSFRNICNWELSVIESQVSVKKVFAKPKPTLYPVKLLRYWFMFNLLKDEQSRLGRPLRICEIGVDRGQMLQFTQDTGFREFSTWVAVDCQIQGGLKKSGYSKQIEADVDFHGFFLEDEYDVIIVLHILEHLFEPESLVVRLSDSLAPGGILIGGFPVTPKWIAAYWQKRIRSTASKYGHVSVFSPHRVKKMAQNARLNLDFLSGAFFLRKSGSVLENFKGWLRLNLFWGTVFPSLGGEIYWQMSK